MGGRSGTLVGREVLGRGPELGVGWGEKTHSDPLWPFPKHQTLTDFIRFLKQTNSPAEVLPKMQWSN